MSIWRAPAPEPAAAVAPAAAESGQTQEFIPMITQIYRSGIRPFFTAGLILLSAGYALAQAPGGGGGRGGGFGGLGALGGVGGGFGGGGGAAGSANSVRQYTNSSMVGDAMITSDMESRNLIVVTDEMTYQIIKTIIADLDKPRPQVLIDCVFVQVTHTNELDLGTEMTYRGPVGFNNPNATTTTQFGIGLANASGTANSSVPDLATSGTLLTTIPNVGSLPTSGSPSSNGIFYSLVGRDVNATIHALAAVNKTEVLSRPSILTRNNQQATILVGQVIPIITSSSAATSLSPAFNTITQSDIGIILKVTPFITAEGNVEMILDPVISSLSGTTVPIGNNVSYPAINMISADTVVVTPNNQTVVIGGLMQTQNNVTENKIPLLGDIPLLGNAFKYSTSNKAKTELIIFLTPHIVHNPSDLAQLSIEEQGRMALTPNAFGKAELSKYNATAK
jgi:general secretion pathway protein D